MAPIAAYAQSGYCRPADYETSSFPDYHGKQNSVCLSPQMSGWVLRTEVGKVMGRDGVEMVVFVQEGLETDVLFFALESGLGGNVSYSPSRKVSCITRQWADQIIRQSAERVGLQSDVHAHLFTHDYAMNILNCGGHLDAFQEQLGHRYVNTTPVSLRPFDEDLKRGFASLLPNVHGST